MLLSLAPLFDESDLEFAPEPAEAPRRTPPQCWWCGRFTRASSWRRRGPDLIGATRWDWHCSRCGDAWESS